MKDKLKEIVPLAILLVCGIGVTVSVFGIIFDLIR